VEPGANVNLNQLHMISGLDEMVYLLQNPQATEELEFLDTSPCKVPNDGENFAKAIKQSSVLGDASFSKSMSKMVK
jgi:hypothetical protein